MSDIIMERWYGTKRLWAGRKKDGLPTAHCQYIEVIAFDCLVAEFKQQVNDAHFIWFGTTTIFYIYSLQTWTFFGSIYAVGQIIG